MVSTDAGARPGGIDEVREDFEQHYTTLLRSKTDVYVHTHLNLDMNEVTIVGACDPATVVRQGTVIKADERGNGWDNDAFEVSIDDLAPVIQHL